MESPRGVEECAREAVGAKRPVGALLTFIRDGEHRRTRSGYEGPWFVDVFVRHPEDPALDAVERFGPFDSLDDAERERHRHADEAVLRRDERPR